MPILTKIERVAFFLITSHEKNVNFVNFSVLVSGPGLKFLHRANNDLWVLFANFQPNRKGRQN